MSRQTPSIGLLVQAVHFAADRHRNQRRKDADASPYVNHPIALANVLANEAGIDDIETLCAAILHDTLEDTETTSAELAQRFGDRVAAIVGEVSDDRSMSRAERKRLQIEHARQISRPAKLVKLADKICNVRDVALSPPANWSAEQRHEYADWAAKVIDALRGAHPTLEAIFDAQHALLVESLGTGS